LTIENESIKNQLLQAQNELSFIREHNILIPAKADSSRATMLDTNTSSSNNHQINEELRRLHIAMKLKEGLLTKVKTIVSEEEELADAKITKILSVFGNRSGE